jgi:phosphohistidine phosphatase
MRRLMLIRHAKAEWPTGSSGGDDYDRPLSPRGEVAAPLMGQYLKQHFLLPDLTLISTAVRAQSTFEAIAPFLDGERINEPRLYMAESETLMTLIKSTPLSVRTLLIVGHNPALGDVAVRCVGSGDRYAFARLTAGVPTASLTVLDFDIEDWQDIAYHQGRLDRFVTPHDFEALTKG